MLQRPVQIARGLTIAAFAMVEDAAIEGGGGQSRIDLQSAVIVEASARGVVAGLIGQPSIVEALGLPGEQGDTNTEGTFRPEELAPAIGAYPLIEVGPEVTRLQEDGLLERRGGCLQILTVQQQPAQGVVFPGCPRRQFPG